MATERVVLVTGASSGIGRGLAQRYQRAGARVIMTGRSSARLEHAAAGVPRSVTFGGDLTIPGAREQLAGFVSRLGQLDVLVNNAGVQRRLGVASDTSPWSERQEELDLLLAAPIHLIALLTPVLLSCRNGAQIVNVTSGGAFVPQPFAPAYSAAKAALHSYTTTLRHAFEDTAVAVTELIPPAVATGLAGADQAHGVDVGVFCDSVFPLLEQRIDEVGYGPTASPEFQLRLRAERESFTAAATRFPITRYHPG